MRLRTKLLFAFLVSPVFLLFQSLWASNELRSVGKEVDNLEGYTQSEDLRGQVVLEMLRIPDPQTVALERARARDLVHAERAVVLCRSLGRRTHKPEAVRAVARTEEALVEYVSALRDLDAAVAESGPRASFGPEGKRARQAWDALEHLRGRAGPLGTADALEPVAQEAREAVTEIARRTDKNALQLIATGTALAALLTLAAALGLARLTAEPIARLARAARAISRGDLDVRVPVRSTDELGELSTAFNDMTQRLQGVYRGLEATVTERTEELRRREADLYRERKLAAVGRLAAGVAHGVANPLAVIAASAEGLRDRAKEDEELARNPGFADFPAYLERIESEAYRLKRLVRRLLDFARGGTESGEGQVTRHEKLDLAAVARDAVALAQLDPRAKARPIDARALDGASIEVVGDADVLKEALLNLVFNALDATEQNAGRVSVAARRRGSSAGELAQVEVADTGEGISRENLDRLFEPFFTTKPPGAGTGLGLAVAYGAAERHGGRLVAASEGKGKGARFVLEIPTTPGSSARLSSS